MDQFFIISSRKVPHFSSFSLVFDPEMQLSVFALQHQQKSPLCTSCVCVGFSDLLCQTVSAPDQICVCALCHPPTSFCWAGPGCWMWPPQLTSCVQRSLTGSCSGLALEVHAESCRPWRKKDKNSFWWTRITSGDLFSLILWNPSFKSLPGHFYLF